MAANLNKWNLGTTGFFGTMVEFAKSTDGPWDATPSSPSGYRYARVLAQAALPLYFLPVLSTSSPGGTIGAIMMAGPNMTVKADSAAGQSVVHTYHDGLFPFSVRPRHCGPTLRTGPWTTIHDPLGGQSEARQKHLSRR